MLGKLFLLFTIVPLMELVILIKLGGQIGAINTILLVIGTAVAGAALARFEGLKTLQQIQLNLAQGIVPAEELIDGMMIFAGGVLLLTPGLLTDAFALLLLFPASRLVIKRWLRRRFDAMVAAGNVHVMTRRHDNDFL